MAKSCSCGMRMLNGAKGRIYCFHCDKPCGLPKEACVNCKRLHTHSR